MRGEISYVVNASPDRLHVLVGTPRDREVRLKIGEKEQKLKTTKEGVLWFRSADVVGKEIVVDFGPQTHTDAHGHLVRMKRSVGVCGKTELVFGRFEGI